jgi:hypothetical protein
MVTVDHEPRTLSGVEVASLPWAFTQLHPLDTGDFIKEAGRRGLKLDISILRALYRHGLFYPVVAVRDRSVGPPTGPPESEPTSTSGRARELRHARDRGRLLDLATVPYKQHLRFDRPDDAPFGWWDGLLYSQHQLVALKSLEPVVRRCRTTWRPDRTRRTTLRPPQEREVALAADYRRIALVAAAIEARYLPELDPEWIHLVGTGTYAEEWQHYRKAFDPVAMAALLGCAAEGVRRDAERLLSNAHRMDPVGDAWGRLIRRSPKKSWRELKGDALLAMDHRITAELLLRFYEDLAAAGAADPLPQHDPAMGWHPLGDRLSARWRSLDQDLTVLGVSPHPRVVLAIEGDTEQLHVSRVWSVLRLPNAPELLRVIKLGGVDKDPVLAGMLAATPLLEGQDPAGNFWWGAKPPTCFMIAADPEGRYYGARKVDGTRRKILDAIKEAISAQGAAVDEQQLEPLVEIHTWSASCYEFAHFTDAELATAIASIHTTCNGQSHDQVVAELRRVRRRNEDIKKVWAQWDYQPSKTKLAEALWPVLERKIIAARSGGPVPEVAEVLHGAYATAQGWRHRRFVWPAKVEG